MKVGVLVYSIRAYVAVFGAVQKVRELIKRFFGLPPYVNTCEEQPPPAPACSQAFRVIPRLRVQSVNSAIIVKE